MSNQTIIRFHNIVQLEIVKRPSSRIKSPYVADAIDKKGVKSLVHTPGLGLADQCLSGSKIFGSRSKIKT